MPNPELTTFVESQSEPYNDQSLPNQPENITQRKHIPLLIVFYAWILLGVGLQEGVQGLFFRSHLMMIAGLATLILAFGIRRTRKWGLFVLTGVFILNLTSFFISGSDLFTQYGLVGTLVWEGVWLIYFWITWRQFD